MGEYNIIANVVPTNESEENEPMEISVSILKVNTGSNQDEKH